MSKFIKTLSLFIASIPLIAARTSAAMPSDHRESVEPLPMPNLDPVQLRPLNHGLDNLFAGHRSHSSHRSHASHASHYSGSSGSGSYSAPRDTTPTQNLAPQAEVPTTSMPNSPTYQFNDTPTTTNANRSGSPGTVPQLNTVEKRKLQVMRVQIALTGLGIYTGIVDGEFSDDTQEALKRFQLVKGLPPSGLMTTDTLNALGVIAVQ